MLLAKKIKEMINKYKAGDIIGAREIQFDIYTLQKSMFKAPNPAPIKAALDILGLNLGGKVRLPLVDVNEDIKELIKSELRKFYNF
jgi:4-hydroxy-tetrahydrodipicolinate synthase